MTYDEWLADGKRRFGADFMDWRFVCPVCKHVAAVRDWQAAGAPQESVAFSCVGRWTKEPRDAFRGDGPGPCNYAGGGLFMLNPIEVTLADGQQPNIKARRFNVFAYAEPGP